MNAVLIIRAALNEWRQHSKTYSIGDGFRYVQTI